MFEERNKVGKFTRIISFFSLLVIHKTHSENQRNKKTENVLYLKKKNSFDFNLNINVLFILYFCYNFLTKTSK